MSQTSDQKVLCKEYSAEFLAPEALSICGVAKDVGSGVWPINGLRHPATDGTTGWFIYSGEVWSDAADFFEPSCTDHVIEREPLVTRYLGLAPGWRFLITPDYQDVWFDKNLLTLDVPRTCEGVS